jgi:hypothetical protein
MRLDELRARGGLVDSTLVKTPVEWKKIDEDGKEDLVTFDVFIRKNSFGLIDLGNQAARENRSRSATIIAGGVLLGEHGEEVMTYDDAYALEPSLSVALFNAFMKVNKPRDNTAKNSQPPTSSGTN